MAAVAVLALMAASTSGVAAAPPPDGRGWLGEELPLPLAVRTAQQVRTSGERAELDPMTAVERKVVHLRLKEFEGVETASEGTEPNRYVVVLPA